MTPTVLIIGGGLGLLLLVVGLALTFLGERSVVEERLGRYAEGTVASATGERVKRERGSIIADYLERAGEGSDLFDNLARDLARADLKLRPAEYIAAIVISILGFAAIGFVMSSSMIFAIAAAIPGALVPRAYVKMQEKSRLKKFDNQLSDMLNLMVNGLRAGFSTLQAMEAVSRELPSPINEEFHRVVQEMQLGIAMEEALDHLLRRIDSEDLDLVITAINVQREVGGNLAEILDSISFTIRERVRIKGEIAALTAQGRATAWVISAMPVILTALLFLINREYIMQFFNPETRSCGIPLISLAGIMIVVGFIATQKIVDIDI
ncbi:MAG: type II secretion system F family protein [Anaerolineales bacterium]|nr:type II secretion system F family protein [Anaerolineales bacterium]MCK5634257.1 type II secretion system F family protein [Anaerolineales bacterium]